MRVKQQTKPLAVLVRYGHSRPAANNLFEALGTLTARGEKPPARVAVFALCANGLTKLAALATKAGTAVAFAELSLAISVASFVHPS